MAGDRAALRFPGAAFLVGEQFAELADRREVGRRLAPSDSVRRREPLRFERGPGPGDEGRDPASGVEGHGVVAPVVRVDGPTVDAVGPFLGERQVAQAIIGQVGRAHVGRPGRARREEDLGQVRAAEAEQQADFQGRGRLDRRRAGDLRAGRIDIRRGKPREPESPPGPELPSILRGLLSPILHGVCQRADVAAEVGRFADAERGIHDPIPADGEAADVAVAGGEDEGVGRQESAVPQIDLAVFAPARVGHALLE